MSATSDQRKLSLESLWVLMVTAFVDMLGYALVLPLLPLYAREFGASPFMVGVLLASFAVAQLVSAPLWGRLSDRVGRRPVILGSQLLAAGAYGIFALAEGSVLLLLFSRILQGVGGGTLSVNQAYVSDAVGPEERAKALGWITACTSAGVMIGPAIGSFSASEQSPALPGLIAMTFCLLNVVFAWRWLPEPISAEARRGQPQRRLREALGEVLQRPRHTVSTLIWIYAAGMMAFMAVNGITALYLAEVFRIGVRSIGWFYVAIGFVSVLMRGLVLGFLVERFGEVRTLRLGASLLTLGLLIAPFAQSPLGFLLALLFMPMGTALLFPSTTSLVSRYSDPKEMGQSLGVQQAFGGISRVSGPLLSTAIFGQIGMAEPFWVSAGLVALCLLLSLQLRPGDAARAEARAAAEAAEEEGVA